MSTPKPPGKLLPVAIVVGLDILLIGAALCVFALFHHVLPRAYATGQTYGSAASAISTPAATSVTTIAFAGSDDSQGITALIGDAGGAATEENAGNVTTGSVATDLGGGKFADKFTDGQVIATATSYMSANVNVTLSQVQRSGVTYYVEDIYIRDISNLRTAFAQDTYGRSITDWVLTMAQDNDAIAAINGDYYGTTASGAVIRNGVLYNDQSDGDVCVLFRDGTVQIVPAADFDAAALMAAGAYQAWDFGPSLLSADGTALTRFNSRISGSNPRTAIGYIEPGHYVFVAVDGRQAGYSSGMTLAQLAALMADLGCEVAYNLDGGKTSAMTFGDSLANQPAQGGRASSDIIYIGE